MADTSTATYPIPSSNADVLEYNAKRIDDYLDANKDEFTDRDGKKRKTLRRNQKDINAAIRSSTSQDLGEYAANITFNNHNEYVTYGGVSYKPKDGIDLPIVTDLTTYPLVTKDPRLMPFSSDTQSYSFTSIANMKALVSSSGFVLNESMLKDGMIFNTSEKYVNDYFIVRKGDYSNEILNDSLSIIFLPLDIDPDGSKWCLTLNIGSNLIYTPIATAPNDSEKVQLIQYYFDYAEEKDLTLELDPRYEYELTKNLYLGNIRIKSNNAKINVVSGESFVENGSAINKSEGVILTKSAASAGYGIDAVSLEFDVLNVNFERDNASGPKTAMLIENTKKFVGSLNINTKDSNIAKCPLDFYGGVQGVRLSNVECYVNNQNQAESAWIRNAYDARATKDIIIDTMKINVVGADEGLAIYNFNTGGTSPEISDVHINKLIVNTSGKGQGVSILNNYAENLVKDITIDSLTVNSDFEGSSPFGLKNDGGEVSIGTAEINISAKSTVSGFCYGARHLDTNNNGKTKIANLSINLLSRGNDTATIYAAGGNLQIGNFSDNSYLGGSFDRHFYSLKSAQYVNLNASVLSPASGCARLTGHINGRIEGFGSFSGSLTLDDENNNGIVFYNSGTVPEFDGQVFVNATIINNSSKTIEQICNFSGSPINHHAASISYDVFDINDRGITSSDYTGSKYPLRYYDCSKTNSTGATRINKTLTI